MSVRNLDYEILEFVSKSKTPVHMCDISSKFKSTGRSVAVDLCKQRLLYWHTIPGDIFVHDDDTCVIEITQSGMAEYGRYKYDRQLKSGEVWINRIWGIAATLIVESLVLLMTNAKEVLEFLLQLL